MYKKFFSILLIYTVFATVVTARHKYDSAESVGYSDEYVVYVAGREGNVAVLWTNGVARNLTSGTNDAAAFSVFVSEDNTVYVAGFERNREGISVATLWINGVAKRLYEHPFETAARSVFVTGGDVYVAGHIHVGGTNWPIYWKNDEIVQLEAYADYPTSTTSIFVAGSNVYLAGYDSHRPFFETNMRRGADMGALLWENDDFDPIAIPGIANCVLVSDDDVYIGGNDGNAALWKNGETQELDVTGHRAITSVFVSGDDVYAVGRPFVGYWRTGQTINPDNGAFLWKNGVSKRLDSAPPNVVAGANSVVVIGNNVYVAGDEDGVATVWRNSEAPIRLGDQEKKNSVAESIFVHTR